MKIKIKNGIKSGKIIAPPSKSMAHRALICAALSSGKSTIHGIIPSMDMHATMRALNLLGAKIEYDENAHKAEVCGVFSSGGLLAPNEQVNCGESGSTLRFMIPLFSIKGEKTEFCGGGKLLSRPQNVYEKLYSEKGLVFSHTEETIMTKGQLLPGEYHLNGDVSSQFITGLLFALPLLNGDSTIYIKPPFESKSYVDLTKKAMADFGVEFDFIYDLTIKIKGNQKYTSHDYTVEGDYSQIAFWAVLAACSNTQIKIDNIAKNTKQGDAEILNVLKNCGANIMQNENDLTVLPSENTLKAFNADIANCPDLGPILMVLALFCEGESIIDNAARLRVKESDRIEAMRCEIEKIGGNLSADENTVKIIGAKNKLHSAKNLYGHNDHRIVMAMSVAAVCMGMKDDDFCEIDGAQAIEKSYPDFFDLLFNLYN